MDKPRIVSLLPAATETLFALGLGRHIVGRSHECDFPAEAQQIPICSRSRLKAPEGQSQAIHEDLQTLLAQALAIYEVDLERLRELQPTHIVTQHQCSICAVSLSDVEQALSTWLGQSPHILSFAPQTLEDIFEDILELGRVLHATFAAEDLVGKCLRRMNFVIARGQDMRQKPNVACIEWTEPLMMAGYWVPQLVTYAGGHALLAEAGQHAPPIALEALAKANPDLILAMPCGYNLEQTQKAIEALSLAPLWSTLRAVQEDRVFISEGHQYFSRPGPRMADSLEILAEILHPACFSFGYEGHGWKKFVLP